MGGSGGREVRRCERVGSISYASYRIEPDWEVIPLRTPQVGALDSEVVQGVACGFGHVRPYCSSSVVVMLVP